MQHKRTVPIWLSLLGDHRGEIRLRGCLVHFAKLCKDVKMAFEVLNEVYLQNFLHRWVVNHETNLMMLINPCLINN